MVSTGIYVIGVRESSVPVRSSSVRVALADVASRYVGEALLLG